MSVDVRSNAGTSIPPNTPDAWERVLRSAARVQERVPGAVVCDHTATAMHARHHIPAEVIHCIDTREHHIDAIRTTLEIDREWTTALVQSSKILIGSQNGVQTSIHSFRHSAPMDTEVRVGTFGSIRLSTAEDTLRMQTHMALKRNTMRDYLDVAAMWDHLGDERGAKAFRHYDGLYSTGTDESTLKRVMTQLANPQPNDLDRVDLTTYPNLDPKWQEWSTIAAICRQAAYTIFDAIPIN